MMKFIGIWRCTPADHMYAVGCLNSRSMAVMPNGSDPAPPTPPGLSASPLLTPTCGWNGGLPPRNIESLTVTRLWNTPVLNLRIVFSLTAYAAPTRGSKTFACVSAKPRGCAAEQRQHRRVASDRQVVRRHPRTRRLAGRCRCIADPRRSGPSAGRPRPDSSVVRRRIERRHVVRQRYHGGQYDHRTPPFDRQLARRTPRILEEQVRAERAVLRQRALTDLRVAGEHARARRWRCRRRCCSRRPRRW